MLFDVDGTLVDTPYLHTVCWAEALRQSGYDVPMATVHRSIGMGSDELLEHLLGGGRDKDDDDSLTAAHLTLYKLYWERLRPLPGAVELMRNCAGRGLRVVLASSASKEELAALRSALDADEAIHDATSSTDADAGKPAPDILQAAMDQSGLSPSGSTSSATPCGTARRPSARGVPFVGVTCGGTSEAELREAGAIEVWRDPADLLARGTSVLLG